jgi:TetR/AcrR family transcriptional regulator, fatty acid biosynthesis regulator
MSIRDEKKQQTRNTLLEAALSLMSDGRSFVSISLREVTREAGVVPTAFYRHFKDMDELGLALVDEVCLNLRRLLREERVKAQGAGHIAIKSSVMMFLLYVKQEAGYFDFLARERWSGSTKIREAIQREIRHFATDLNSDLRLFPEMQNLPSEDLQMISDLVINTAMNWCGEILSLPSEQVRLQYELSMQAVKQLRLIFVGAKHWRSDKESTL